MRRSGMLGLVTVEIQPHCLLMPDSAVIRAKFPALTQARGRGSP